MKKILISAFIGSENLGDEAIFKSILANLDIDRSQITALSINEEKTKKTGVNTVFAKKVVNIIRSIRGCDVLLIGGGGIIQDKSSILNFLYYAFQLKVAKHYGKPTILCFVGVGPLNHSLSRWLLGRLEDNIDLAIVRDESSKKILDKYMSDKSKIIVSHDPVLNYLSETQSLPGNIHKIDSPYVVVSLRRWFFTMSLLPVFITRRLGKLSIFRKKYDKFIKSLAKDLDVFLSSNLNMKIIFVSFYDSEDIAVIDDVYKLMDQKERTRVAKKEMNEEQYLSIVKEAEFLVGMRLHSLILATNVCKPFVALRYSPKVDEFTKQFSLLDYSIHVENYSSSKLQAAMLKIYKDAKIISPQIKRKLFQYRSNNEKSFSLLSEKIDKL